MKRSAHTLLFILSLFFFSPIYAQNNIQGGGGGGFTIGYGTMDVSAFNDFLPDNYPKFNGTHLLMGGMGYGFNNRFVMGGGGSALIGDEIINDSLSASIGGGMGTFNFGYLLVNREQMKIFPMLGLGGGGYGLNITNNSNVSTEDIKADPFREISISKGGFIADVSLHFNFLPGLQTDDESGSSGGFMTGLQVGYLWSFPDSRWEYTGGNITGGPNFGLNMFYVKLILGGMGQG